MTPSTQVTAAMIGQPRMDRYLRDCGGDASRAHDLFTWNVAMSGALHESMHMFEIVLRNALDRELSAWNLRQGHSASWLLDPNRYLLRVLDMKSLEAARFRAQKVATAKGRPRTHDDVLAQMTLGTWRYLLPSKASAAKRRLWTESINLAFPLWPGPPQSIVTRVEAVHELRNRVAHLEPLHKSDLRYARRAMRDVCHSTSYSAGRLFIEQERLLPLIEAAPL